MLYLLAENCSMYCDFPHLIEAVRVQIYESLIELLTVHK